MEKDDLIYWTRKLYERGLSPAASGNVSILSDDNKILITASGSSACDIWHDDIIKIDFDGNIIEGCKKPSIEKGMHIGIYKTRPDIRAVIHSHSPEIMAFAIAGIELTEAINPDFVCYFGNVPIADYYMPGTNELAKAVCEKFLLKNAVLLKNHGVVVAGKNLKEAFYRLETLQGYCRAYIGAKLLGKINVLSKKHIKEINNLIK